jgi:hypothetical protein
MEKEEQ